MGMSKLDGYVKEVYNGFLNSKGKGIAKKKTQWESQNVWKKNRWIIPHFQTNILFIFLMFQIINKLWVLQLKLYKKSLNSIDNISISKDFKTPNHKLF